ncbi:MAG TPA: TonB-dependent receptor plug domain-containing protein [Terracidiphilus sp.]|jgi:iron complex outermembrane receptor protein/vitamin B12 transporter|nr:TonB-dependent receptor plug domain-containing protein [Terracidiphilus sp.]
MTPACLLRRLSRRFIAPIFILFACTLAYAAEIHGVVSDASGARITNATVVLVRNGKVSTSTLSRSDGSFQITTGAQGRFYLVISAKGFRQLETPGFYARQFDDLERNLVLEPSWARESIVVTANGTPTPQAQVGAATSVLGPVELAGRNDLVSSLRMMPGTAVAQIGQAGSQASLFIRGGDSDDNEVLIDGVSAGDLGGRFDFGPLSTTALERAEVYRGPDSSLYGADAESGVVNLTTPHGTTNFPSFLFHGDGGNLTSFQDNLEIAGAHNKLDYLGDFTWLQTQNNLPNDQFHVATAAANLGWQPNGSTQVRATVHYGVSAVGVPNAWQFYQVSDDATQKDQDLLISASVENQTTAAFHNTARYGAARRREEYYLWQPSGTLQSYDAFGDQAYFGNTVNILGANGTSASGQAILDYPEQYPTAEFLDSNRDQLVYQGDFRFTPHLQALIGFHFEDERGHEYLPTFATDEQTERTNYVYLAAVKGDFKSRFFYSLGGSLEHYSEFGTLTAPHGSFSVYALRPGKGAFSGTRVLFNFGDANREPALTEEFSSLYRFLTTNGFSSVAQQLNISPLSAPTTRTYEGGVEQSFIGQRLVLRSSYFHNELGRQVEAVGATLLPNILPNLSPASQQQLIQALGFYYTFDYGLAVNTEAFRAQGIETTVEGGIGSSIFLRGGYTYLDAVIQRSFSSDNEALLGGYGFSYNGVPLGAYSPLKGARPFRRPPHTGFVSATYSAHKLTAVFNAAFASRSDDSTYLAYSDQNGDNSLLLPNRNLDFGYAKLDVGASYQLTSLLGIYGQLDNLTNNTHIAPIGYLSLPTTARAGIRIQWGKGSGR